MFTTSQLTSHLYAGQTGTTTTLTKLLDYSLKTTHTKKSNCYSLLKDVMKHSRNSISSKLNNLKSERLNNQNLITNRSATSI